MTAVPVNSVEGADSKERNNRMRVELDEPKCVASGQCVVAAPDVFDQRDEDGVAVVLQDTPPDEVLEDVREAVAVCPAAALRLVGE
ncbi:ferredoxin [Nocardiopsis synnemataformans]|uniref:ferredoxin n=1 Tax=Nocardiopsis synnemataformans TaxID=61305 RepID=UPI003EC079A4